MRSLYRYAYILILFFIMTALMACRMPMTETKKPDAHLIVITNAFDLIENNYVDSVDPNALAQKGVAGMEEYLRDHGFDFTGQRITESPLPHQRSKSIGYLSAHYTRFAGIPGINPGDLQYAAIEAMTKSLDSYTVYLTPALLEDLKTLVGGSYFGLGIEVALIDDEIVVLSPVDNTPASRAGIRPGDRIRAINGTPTRGMSLLDAYRMLRGPMGTAVQLTIQRGTSETTNLVMTRELIELRSLRYATLANGIGYIRISFVTNDTTKELKRTIDLLREKGPLNGLILDLRNNPGGLLEESIAVCDLFLKSGTIVNSRGKPRYVNRVYPAYDQGNEPACPIVILINEGTASASEIIAFALHNNNRAALIGARTFGKAIIQNVTEFNDGSALQLTIARYYAGDGSSFDEKGVPPDLVVKHIPYDVGSPKTAASETDQIPTVYVPAGAAEDATLYIAHSVLSLGGWSSPPSRDHLRELAEKVMHQ